MASPPAVHPPFHRSLYFKVLLAILIGVVLGVLSPSNPKVVPESLRGLIILPLGWAEAMKPFGDAFIKMIRMLIAPIIFCTVVHGIANMGDMKKVGRVGLKALLYFELVTTAALVVGMAVINVLRPGAGMNIDATTIDTKSITTFVA
jgi:aerobic C4-dicarboxylate transport protein